MSNSNPSQRRTIPDHPPQSSSPATLPGTATSRPAPSPSPSTANAPSSSSASVAPVSFYGTSTSAASNSTSRPPPPLPQRPEQTGAGSAHTRYIPPTALASVSPAPDPPAYGVDDDGSTPYREPELVANDDDDGAMQISSFVRPDDSWADANDSWKITSSWPPAPAGLHGADSWNLDENEWKGRYGGSAVGAEAGRAIVSEWATEPKVLIDGRNLETELAYWDPAVRARDPRPGPGWLPPLLLPELSCDNALYIVLPNDSTIIGPSRAPAGGNGDVDPPPLPPPVPSPDEIRAAVPHAHAHYRAHDNSWVVIITRRSSVLPSVLPTAMSGRVLPGRERRAKAHSCAADDSGTAQFGPSNFTHHFHRYEDSVDPLSLNPPVNGLPGDAPMHLFVCCQCTLFVLVSRPIPGLIDYNLMQLVTADKMASPPLGKSQEDGVMTAWETLLT
jgi:ubiquitin carboxyl-terminal hydrolase 25